MLRRYRAERRDAVRQYVGNHWSEEGTSEKVPVNLISLYISVVGRNLIAKNPRVMLSTFNRGQKPTVAIAQDWANKEIEKLHLADTLKRVVIDGLFSLGICKVALATPQDAAQVAWRMQAGKPCCERVDLDDFVYDIHARDFNEVGYIGHRYRVPLEVVKDDENYSKARKELAASTDNPYNLEGDERISTLGRGVYAGNSEEFEDFVDLWEVYLPRHRLVLTLADDQLTGAATVGTGGVGESLREQKWLGPDTGPYHLLSYGLVPGNAMPKGPIQDLIDLHMFGNQTYRKLMRQAERFKEVMGVSGGATEDGSRIMEANDGDIIRVDNPERMKPTAMGGPAQSLLAMFQQTFDLFNRQAGNLELLAGAAPQSKTLGQDRMLEQNASGQISDMQDGTVDFVAGVLKSLLWYWWNDPFKTMHSTHSLPGLPEMTIRRKATPQQRQQVAWDDLDIRIDPYSMQHKSPQQRLASLNATVTGIIIPMMQLLVQQGISFDMNAYLEKIGRLEDEPDLAEILTIVEPPDVQSQGGGGQQGAPKPATTTRNYERHSQAGGSRQGKDLSMLNAMKPNGQQNGTAQPAGAR